MSLQDRSSHLTGLYDPKAFFTHAALLRQPCGHCAKFLTAASRRSLARVPVPVWLIILSDQLPVVALVGRYPTNQLIGRRPLLVRRLPWIGRLSPPTSRSMVVSGISSAFALLSPTQGQVAYALLTRAPLYSPIRKQAFSSDLHVLSTPPAFILSQDQTLQFSPYYSTTTQFP